MEIKELHSLLIQGHNITLIKGSDEISICVDVAGGDGIRISYDDFEEICTVAGELKEILDRRN